MKIIGIYKITSPTNRIYIGQSTDVLNRTKYYTNPNGCKEQHKLYNSIKKYGWDAHTFEIIEECETTQLNERERYWQDFFNVIVD
jgi:group I intron endonuclease